MAIWVERPTVEALRAMHRGTAPETLGIEFLEIGDEWLSGRMPVDRRTVQPHGIVHGGASVLLAETLGSIGAAHCIDRARYVCVGQEINANHLRAVRKAGSPRRRGRSTSAVGARYGESSCVTTRAG